MRFIQFSDVHLDSSITGALNLSPEKRMVLRQDIRAALARACALVSEIRADIVLIPGDLFDYETVSPETASFAANLFGSLAPIPVFIAPGNHDSLQPGSPYIDSEITHWPANVHIFKNSRFETIPLPELNCTVTGMGHSHRGITQRLLAGSIAADRLGVNILMFHGSLDGYLPSGKETVIPFSDAELLAQKCSYAAIGHYHSVSYINDAAGCVKGAYSGCLQGRDTGEAGEKYVLIGEIAPGGEVFIEKREVAERRVLSLDVDITGLSDNAAVIGKTESLILASGARAVDIISLTLRGSQMPGLEIDLSALETSDRFFHVCVSSSNVVPEYDLDMLGSDSAAPTLKSAYVKRMLEKQSAAADERERKVIQDAIYYGLYALDGRKIEARDAD